MSTHERTRDLDRSSTFRRRRREAQELGLWAHPMANNYEATELRAELASVGFYDFETDRWDRHVVAIRDARRTTT